MKTLIEKSISFVGIGHPNTKTVFNIEDASEREDLRFKSLTAISKRKLQVLFNYDEDGQEKSARLGLTVIDSDNEDSIKESILTEINNYLSN